VYFEVKAFKSIDQQEAATLKLKMGITILKPP